MDRTSIIKNHQPLSFSEWDRSDRQTQISAVAALTAFLYIVYCLLNESSVLFADNAVPYALQLYIVVPLLLLISVLALQSRHFKLVMALLALSPVVSMSCHVYSISLLPDPSWTFVEGYLCIFWIFVVSGMTLRVAILSALVSSSILLVASYFVIDDPAGYKMYVFWIVCSFSFGLLGAFLYERSRKSAFKAYQKIEKLAITDTLTGVFNRSYLGYALGRELAYVHRDEVSVGFMVIDLDHFKNINDQYGHEQGDSALRCVADTLSGVVRSSDTLIRWGGEEFVLIVHNVDEQTLLGLSDDLRNQVEQADCGVPVSLTISIGATMCKKGDNQNSLFARTDMALFKAKRAGRNVTVLA